MPSEGRRMALAGVACALVLGGLAWLLLGGLAWLLLGEGTAPAPEAPANEVGAEQALAVVAERWVGGASAVAASSAAGPASTAASAADGGDRTCPRAWRALAGQSGDVLTRAFRKLQPLALAHAATLLAASSDPFERVAGRLLAARAVAPDQPLPPDAFLTLVSEALGSGDPRVAGLAAQLCSSPSSEPPAACASFTPQQWAAIDPDNVQPWLALAAQAQDQGDAATVREAMARAAQAHGTRLVSTGLPRLAASPALQALPPQERQALVIDLVGVGNMLTAVGSLEVSRLCPGQAMGAPRVAQCSAVAELLVAQAPTLLERGIGISIGRRTGWPAERVDALDAEYRALLGALTEAMVFGLPDEGLMTEAQACAAYRRIDAVTSMVSADDEVALARRALAQAGAASQVAAP